MNKGIIIFTVVSLSLHAGLFMMLPSSQKRIEAGSPFRVSIVAAREQASVRQHPGATTVAEAITEQRRVAKKHSSRVAVHKPAAMSRQSTPATSVQATTTTTDLARADTTLAVAAQTSKLFEPSVAMVAQTSGLLRAELQQAFRLQFYYPRLAIRRGWQGEVRLGLTVAANGMLENIHILQSSGHGILDRAALQCLGKVEQLPSAAALLKGQELALELPVQYRLL